MRLKGRKKNMTALFIALASLCFACQPQGKAEGATLPADSTARIEVGVEVLLTDQLQLLRNKRVAIVANQTSVVGKGTHLVDTLVSLGIRVQKIFSPEHGFRGDHGAGERVNSATDEVTGLPLVSLYGSTKKPTAAMLADVDIVLFDIQDVGTRFYTYISTMSLVMEACAEKDIPVVVCDRPNPNGQYVAGPVRKDKFKSFVGMHPVPTVYGMTMGEYAKMVNGEGWLAGGAKCRLIVVPCKGYTHDMTWAQTGLKWIAPSPNLATEYAAYLYPILCWYEGMPVSIGRGTDEAFTLVGAPWHKGYENQIKRDSALYEGEAGTVNLYGLTGTYTRFTPHNLPGKAASPLFENKTCFGIRFNNRVSGENLFLAGLSLLKNFEEESRNVGLAEPLFQPYFDTLTGNDELKKQIQAGLSPEQIVESWKEDLKDFKVLREKYLLYP